MLNKAKRFAAKAIATVIKVVKRVFKRTKEVVKYYFELWERYPLNMFLTHVMLIMAFCGINTYRMTAWIIINTLAVAYSEWARTSPKSTNNQQRAYYNQQRSYSSTRRNTNNQYFHQEPKKSYTEVQQKMHKTYVNLMAKANGTTNGHERDAFMAKAQSIKVKYAL